MDGKGRKRERKILKRLKDGGKKGRKRKKGKEFL